MPAAWRACGATRPSSASIWAFSDTMPGGTHTDQEETMSRVLYCIARTLAVALATFLLAGTAAAQQPFKIGFGMSLTGPLGGNGTAALIAMELWRDDVNAKGGILGRKVEFIHYDDQTNPATVPGIYTKLLDVDKVDLVVSGYDNKVIGPDMPT